VLTFRAKGISSPTTLNSAESATPTAPAFQTAAEVPTEVTAFTRVKWALGSAATPSPAVIAALAQCGAGGY